MRTWRVILLLLVGCAAGALAGNRSGSVSGQFLKIPTDPRIAAIGNISAPFAEGAMAIPFNAAGLLSVENISAAVSYHQWWADIRHMYAGVGINLDWLGTIGVGVIMLSTDDMPVRTPAFPEGTGELFKSSEYAFSFSYARHLSEQFALGLSVRYISSNLYNGDIGASAIAFDFGTLYDITVLRTRLGITITNLGQDVKYLYEQYSIPTTLRFGARTTAYETEGHRVYVGFQISRPNDANEQYNIGVEYGILETVYLRGGYKFNYDTENWCGGIGVSLARLGIDGDINYAYSNYKYLPGTHLVSLELGF